jgi:hypothetical protein
MTDNIPLKNTKNLKVGGTVRMSTPQKWLSGQCQKTYNYSPRSRSQRRLAWCNAMSVSKTFTKLSVRKRRHGSKGIAGQAWNLLTFEERTFTRTIFFAMISDEYYYILELPPMHRNILRLRHFITAEIFQTTTAYKKWHARITNCARYTKMKTRRACYMQRKSNRQKIIKTIYNFLICAPSRIVFITFSFVTIMNKSSLAHFISWR